MDVVCKSVTALAVCLFLASAGTVVADTAALRDPGPVIIELPEPPRDNGHRHTSAELSELASRVQSQSSGSSPKATSGQILFRLPLRKGIGNSRPGYYAISNYVDQDPAAPDMLLDYECGERTYDLDDGSNHNGVDYFNFPFSWLAMQQDASIVVAAADGTIIEKQDGEPDRNCAFSDSAQSNQVVLEHADGSVSIYTHLKKNSTTSRNVGETVETGDYLGVVGSSGFSNGPHLHFGVYDPQGGLIEPHAGACNTLNDASWWENQEEYYVPGLNYIATHSDVPEFPDCPGVEKPKLKDNFAPGETGFFSVFFRDILEGEAVSLEIRNPDDAQILQWDFNYEDAEHEAALMVVWAIDFGSSAPSGSYTFRVTYAGVVREHTFYIDSGPAAPPVAPTSNRNYNGLWFDPALDGEGYNFVTTPNGTIVYFYGNDQNGNRLWLISDLISGPFGGSGIIEVTMFESTGGTFGAPVPSARGLSIWGTLTVEFSGCNNAETVLSGEDGHKVSQIIKLAGVAGADCAGSDATPDSPWSGLWFDPADDGEGYNLVVAPNGAILYYYGFTSSGDRLWLISDLIAEQLQVGAPVEIEVYEATQGDFGNPAPSSQLSQWGTTTITLTDCGQVTIELVGDDGSKSSATVRLAGIIGLGCSN